MFWYWGYFRSAWATVPLKPGYGIGMLAPRAAGELMFEFKSAAPSDRTLGSFML